MLDRIDEIVAPGTNVNPADGGWQSPALEAPSAATRSRISSAGSQALKATPEHQRLLAPCRTDDRRAEARSHPPRDRPVSCTDSPYIGVRDSRTALKRVDAPHHKRRRSASIRRCVRMLEIVAGATRMSRRPRRGRRSEAPANAASSTIPRMYTGEGSCSGAR